uniref:Late embryogenesis abundant protein LEA-2 subgroup domain-containing protein n=1 Tax=Dichanthelium oligosanthes TaxID=888268 RepID=A0A1E5UMK6_9POAL
MASTTAGNGTGSVLPTHTANPSAPALPSSSKPPPQDPRRRRRCLCVCLLVTLAVLAALAITILVLCLTVLKVRDPTTRLVSTSLAGVAPGLTFPAISLQLNVTLLLTVAVHNPNPASFAYDTGGHTDLTYRGAHVGDAEIDPGRIPSKGDEEVKLALTVQADRMAADLAQLVADVESGSVAMEANTRIPGRVTILGLFKRHAVAYSDCSFVIDVAGMKVRSQECHYRTKL